MAQVIESGKAIRLQAQTPLSRRRELRPWKVEGYRIPAPDGVTIWHEQEAIRRLVLQFFREVDVDLFLFGSQASGTSGHRSDYDVGFSTDEAVAPARLSELRGRLEELPIPSHVEIVDFRKVPKRFSDAVLRRKEALEVWKRRQKNSFFI